MFCVLVIEGKTREVHLVSQDDTNGLVGTTSHFVVLRLGSDGIWVDWSVSESLSAAVNLWAL